MDRTDTISIEATPDHNVSTSAFLWPFGRRTYLIPSDLNNINLDSSLKSTFNNCSLDQLKCSLAIAKRQHPENIIVWGGICSDGSKAPQVFVPGQIFSRTQRQYIELTKPSIC